MVKRKWWLYSWLSSLPNLYHSSTSFSWLHYGSHWEYRVIWTGLAELTDWRSLQEAELQPLHLAELRLWAFHIQQNFSHPERLCAIPAIAKGLATLPALLALLLLLIGKRRWQEPLQRYRPRVNSIDQRQALRAPHNRLRALHIDQCRKQTSHQ